MSHHSPFDPPFSKRQLDVIEHWGRTFDPAAVAHALNIKVNTVQTHLRRMRQKLGVKRTVEVWEYVGRRMDHKNDPGIK